MPDVIPFTNIRYNVKAVSDMSKVVAPPYDVISADEQEEYYNTHQNNIIRIILGKDEAHDDEDNDKYIRAANYFREWQEKLVMFEDDKSAYFIHEQEFKIPGEPGNKTYKRTGFCGLVKIEPYSKGNVLAHEETFKAPKIDRLKLFTSVQANFCPVMMVYQDEKKETPPILKKGAKGKPEIEIKMPDGVIHRFWTLSNSNTIQRLRGIMKDKKLLIADGHHQYETAIRYMVEMHRRLPNVDNHQPFDYTLAYLTSSDDEGLKVMPTHRVLCNDLGDGVDREEFIEDLEMDFDVNSFKVKMSDVAASADSISKNLKKCDAKQPGLVVLFPDGEAHAISLQKGIDLDEIIEDEMPAEIKSLPITLLQKHIIPRAWIGNPEIELEHGDCMFTHTIEAVVEALNNRKGCVAFILNPVGVDTIFDVATKGFKMPQKTTYFYPKVMSGLVCHDMSLRS